MGRVSISDRMSQGLFLSDVVDVCEQFKFMLAGRYDYYKYRSATVELENGYMTMRSRLPIPTAQS